MLDPQYLQQDSTSDTEEESTENPPKTISTQPPPIFPPPVSLPPVSPISPGEENMETKHPPTTKICLKFQMNSPPPMGGGPGSNPSPGKKQPLKSPLMPTSCTATSGSVNLTYNFPTPPMGGGVGGGTPHLIPKIPIGALSPVHPPELDRGYELPQILTVPISGAHVATPPILMATPIYDQSTEELYSEEILNANVDMALYSPLPHLHFHGGVGHAPQIGGVPLTPTPLEDWIKQPNNLTLSSDALMASLQGDLSSPATPTSFFSDQALPPFSSTHTQVELVNQGFALPPLENTLDLETVDLEALPS